MDFDDVIKIIVPIIFVVGFSIFNAIRESMEQAKARRGPDGPPATRTPEPEPEPGLAPAAEPGMHIPPRERLLEHAKRMTPPEYTSLSDGSLIVYDDVNQYLYLEQTPCANCGTDGYVGASQREPEPGLSEIVFECTSCGHTARVLFDTSNPAYQAYLYEAGEPQHELLLPERRTVLEEGRARRVRQKKADQATEARLEADAAAKVQHGEPASGLTFPTTPYLTPLQRMVVAREVLDPPVSRRRKAP